MAMLQELKTVGSLNSQQKRPPSRQVSNVPEPELKSGIFGTCSNLVNSIVGAGIIGIPYALRQTGFVAGIALLALVAFFTDKSLRILVETASFHPKLKDYGVLTYEDLMSVPFGTFGSLFVLINMLILSYGAMVAYLLIVKDTVPIVLGLDGAEEDAFVAREVTMIIVSLVTMLPLSMLRDMASLAFTSVLSVIADVILVVFVICYSPIPSSMSYAGGFGEVLKNDWIHGSLFIGLGVLSDAMACQHSAFIVSGSLEDKTSRRWSMVTFRSLTTAAILCIVLGVTGYLGFLEDTQGNILNNFDSGLIALNIGRGLLAITMMLTYPMEVFVARHVVAQLLYKGDLDNISYDEHGNKIPEDKFLGVLGRRETITLLLHFAALLAAVYVDDLGPVLSLTGSTGASCLAYIGPGLVYLGINGEAFLSYVDDKLKPRGRFSGRIEPMFVCDADVTFDDDTTDIAARRKPWWWWVCGFPIWVAIASAGAHGTNKFLTKLQCEVGDPFSCSDSSDSDEVIGPKTRDYYVSMVFITFGVFVSVVGVASNMFVQMDDVFDTNQT